MIKNNEILNKIDWNVLNKYVNDKLIIINKHPEYDLWILNYSKEAQFSKAWDIYTMSCRGLVIDNGGTILARPFKKFLNLEEHDVSEIDMSLPYNVYEKMDGSLIVMFWYEPINDWILASRGSFASEQAIEARKMFDSIYNIKDCRLVKDMTYLFEILYPENRIVVNYGNKRELVMLACIDKNNGLELNYYDMVNLYSEYFSIVKKYDVKVNDLIELKRLEEDNKEGFVVRFSNGFRVKVKFSEYVRLHGILTNVSNKTVWEYLKDNNNLDELIDRVPDEFFNRLQKIANNLRNEFNEIERLALKEYIRIYDNNRKTFALEAIKSKYSGILFKIYDKKPYDEIIWKLIKPDYSKPFKDGFDDN